MVAISKALLFAGVASAAVQVRDFNAVTADLTTLNSYVTVLSKSVAAYSTGVNAALAVQSAETNVENQVKKTTTDVANTSGVTAAQTTTIINYFKNTLVGNIQKTLNALIAKKTNFNNAGVGGIVRSDLSALSSSAKSLANSLVAKATPASNKASASALSSTVISLFGSAISAYGN